MSYKGILHDAVRNSIVDKSKDKNGKVDVNRALSVARAKGYNTFEDRVRIINRANIQNKK